MGDDNFYKEWMRLCSIFWSFVDCFKNPNYSVKGLHVRIPNTDGVHSSYSCYVKVGYRERHPVSFDSDLRYTILGIEETGSLVTGKSAFGSSYIENYIRNEAVVMLRLKVNLKKKLIELGMLNET